MTWWAPSSTGPFEATVQVPGSKSATARALVLSAIAMGPGSIQGGLRARDTDLMIAGLNALGARIDVSDAQWSVEPIEQFPAEARIDCGLAGTVMRFLPALAASGPVRAQFVGDPAASARPMEPLLEALGQLGAYVDGTCLPFTVTGPVSRRDVVIDSSASSQFISALLLAGPRYPSGVRVTHRGGALPSLPHILMTVAALEARGVEVGQEGSTWETPCSPVRALDEVIEPDLTTAAVFLASALVAGGRVSVPGWPRMTTQPGARTLDILSEMGGEVLLGPSSVTVSGTGDISGIDIDLNDTSELTPVVAGLAALADSPTVIRGVGHIRGHETDRLLALSTEITALGGDCEETEDGLIIRPRPLHPGVFHTYADHRMAHAGALIGLTVPGVKLDDVACTSKTMPDFPRVWEAMVS